MKRGFVFIFFSAILNLAAFAQVSDTTIVFNKSVHDFGTIVKSDGAQTYSFEFTNKNPHPVTIQSVRTSCGCTTSVWTKEPVASGAKGYVKVTYTPSGATTFKKSVTVNIDGKEIVLLIRGVVVI